MKHIEFPSRRNFYVVKEGEVTNLTTFNLPLALYFADRFWGVTRKPSRHRREHLYEIYYT